MSPIEREEMSSGECWRRIRSATIGRIAYVDDRTGIEVFPVNFVVDHGSIVLRTAQGTKLTGLAAQPEVVFEVDGGDPAGSTAWCVIARGSAESIEVHDEIVDAFDLDLTTWHGAAKPFFVRVVPSRVEGHHMPVDDRSATSDP